MLNVFLGVRSIFYLETYYVAGENKKGELARFLLKYCPKTAYGRKANMQSAVYSAVFGSTTQGKRLDVIANNLANVNTTGYKRVALSFCNSFRDRPATDPSITQTRINKVEPDLSQGGMTVTGNPLDLAIDGKGFFKLETPGGLRYTRAGVFRLDGQGTMVDAHGNALQGENGSIVIPRNANVVIGDDGEVRADGNVVGRIAVVNFPYPERLEQFGGHLFKLPKASRMEEEPAADATVNQGFLERSNVEVVQAMVRMIEVSRNVEAEQKIMTTSATMDEKAVNNVGRP